MKRPIESDYTSHVAYTRALEAYCDWLSQTEQEPVGYVQTVIDALYENSDPISVEAAELLERMVQPEQEPVECVEAYALEDLSDGRLSSHTFLWNANFGQRPFAYTPPTGLKPLTDEQTGKSNPTGRAGSWRLVCSVGHGFTKAIGA